MNSSAELRRLAVVGMGYVGLPVAVAFGLKRPVIGFDINGQRIARLKEGKDDTGEVEADELANAQITFTDEPSLLRQADFIIVAVPTPVDAANRPDLSPLLRASQTVGEHLSAGSIVVFESTVYPGTTEELCGPVLERASGLECGRDFWLGYSPERINPGDREHRFATIRKVVSGQNPEVRKIISEVYAEVVTAGVFEAGSIQIAEAAKIIENTQRDLNIALMNELSLIFRRLGIDTHDVLAAARTKWNFLPFHPGLVGGHCIGVDPYYLTYRAEEVGYHPQVILAGRRINDGMGDHVADQVVLSMIRAGLPIRDTLVTVLGITFKEDVPDLRNSGVFRIIRKLQEYGVKPQVHDPVASAEEARHEYSIDLLRHEELEPAHAVILAVPHKGFREGGWKLTSGLLQGGKGVVADVRAVLPREEKPEEIFLWRL